MNKCKVTVDVFALYKPSDGPDAEKAAINAALDQEVEDFSTWMSNLADIRARGPLMNGEKALLKTYLVQKLKETF